MNINEIKRKINENNHIKTQNGGDITQIIEEPVKAMPRERPTKKYTEDIQVANTKYDEFNDIENNPPPKKNSEFWDENEYKTHPINFDETIEDIVNSLELNDEKYNWSIKSKLGKKSRRNFTNYLINNL
jgi:hypothetical protein